MKKVIGAPYWDQKPVVLVAGGPSLRGFDFNRLLAFDAWIVGVNESIFCLPRCDAGVTVDKVFTKERFVQLKEKIAGGMEMIIATGANVPGPIDATILGRLLTNKLSAKPDLIVTCGTSGYGALNVAFLKRAKHVLLLGYDYSADGAHHHEDYPWHKPPKRADCWGFWAKFYDSTVPQLQQARVDVFNASPKSAIKAFGRGTIDEGLRWLEMAPRLAAA
jgi:hypothetical protein